MSTLLLRLAGPMQSWGESSRFAERRTTRAPTKSGIIGLLAAAQGIRRTDPLEDLLSLSFGVRIDQPGRVEADFQTEINRSGQSLPLTTRYYLTDAIFLAGVEGDKDLINDLDEALHHPVFPLCLGRRSCPPVGKVTLGVRNCSLWEALRNEPWQASSWWKKRQSSTIGLEIRVDAAVVPPDDQTYSLIDTQDEPVSFSPIRREYSYRSVAITHLSGVANPESRSRRDRFPHDPMSALGGF